MASIRSRPAASTSSRRSADVNQLTKAGLSATLTLTAHGSMLLKEVENKKSGDVTRFHTLRLAACLGSASGMLLMAQPSLALPTSTFDLFSQNLFPTPSSTAKSFGNGTPNDPAQLIGPTIQYKVNGITLTVSNPKAGASDRVSLAASNATTSTSGAQNGLAALGTCLGGSRKGIVAICGNPGNATVGAIDIDSIQFSFDKDVSLISIAGNLRTSFNADGTAVNTVISTWTTPSASQAFTYVIDASTTAGINGYNGAYANFQLKSFSSQFSLAKIAANQQITITSNFGDTTLNNLDYWLQNITVREEVPGPLPLLGAGSAFAWSRKLRSRVKSSSKIVKAVN